LLGLRKRLLREGWLARRDELTRRHSAIYQKLRRGLRVAVADGLFRCFRRSRQMQLRRLNRWVRFFLDRA